MPGPDDAPTPAMRAHATLARPRHARALRLLYSGGVPDAQRLADALGVRRAEVTDILADLAGVGVLTPAGALTPAGVYFARAAGELEGVKNG